MSFAFPNYKSRDAGEEIEDKESTGVLPSDFSELSLYNSVVIIASDESESYIDEHHEVDGQLKLLGCLSVQRLQLESDEQRHDEERKDID